MTFTLLSAAGGGINDLHESHTREQVSDRVMAAVRSFRASGLVPGDHLALLQDNSADYIELVLGAIMAGLWVIPVNWHLAREELVHVLTDSKARIALVSPSYKAIAEGMLPVQETDEQWWQRAAACSVVDIDERSPAGGVMLYTSGTTGHPKGVKRAGPTRLGELLSAWRSAGQMVGLDGCGPHLVTGPLYHAAPLLYAIYDLLNGAELVIMRRWDAKQALALIEQFKVRCSHWVPTMFSRVLALPADVRNTYDLSSLHLVLHGAAPISPTLKRQMINWWGPILTEYWGGTESGVCTRLDSSEWLNHPGSVGRPLDGFEVRAFDEHGLPLPSGQEGLLCIHNLRRPEAFHYWCDDTKTAAAYVAPGWFSLGDMGYLDSDGYVHLTDRKSQMIISGGVNIYPAEVERVLAEHPLVDDVCVFGIPDEDWGESVKAAVQLVHGVSADQATAQTLIKFCETRLARYKIPRSVDFHEVLPRTEAGKLYVRRLRDEYWQGSLRRI